MAMVDYFGELTEAIGPECYQEFCTSHLKYLGAQAVQQSWFSTMAMGRQKNLGPTLRINKQVQIL